MTEPDQIVKLYNFVRFKVLLDILMTNRYFVFEILFHNTCYFLRFLIFFSICDGKRRKNLCYAGTNDFDQQMACGAPVRWSKYTT